ncbi:MAG: ABC transporter permease [Phycisphaerae bacterium]
MQTALTNLWHWFWHLLPGNPILVRVVTGASRRTRHLWLRFGYLSVLLFVVLIALTAKVGEGTGSLSDLAKGASSTFAAASVAQLALMCFLAPVFTAGSITQEKDARTYNILLTTPLSNAQIIFGSLMSRLYFVLMLLLAGLPIFFITMVYGGVTASQIIESFALAGGTAILTGSLAIAISMIGVGTRRTIFSFYLAIGIYLLAVYALGVWSGTAIAEAPTSTSGRQLSWLAAFHPFLALEVALNQIPAPEIGRVAAAGWPWKYFYAYPQASYVALTLGLSLVLVVLSMFFVRRGAKQGEDTILSRIGAVLHIGAQNRVTRKPRHVWHNPVAWREAATRASGLTGGLLRYALLGGGALAALLLLSEYAGGLSAAVTRQWLATMVVIEFGIVLLICANVSAMAMTKERESNTLDLLLATPLTSKYIVFGKLRGLVSFTLPMIAVPVASVLLFAFYDLAKGNNPRVAYLESAPELAVLMIAFAAATCMLGMHVSLRSKKTVKAVMVSLGVLIVIMLAASALWWQIVMAFDAAGAALAPAWPYTAVKVICDPQVLFDTPKTLAQNIGTVRSLNALGTAAAVTFWLIFVASIYKAMVRNFDMTLRKQTASH